MVFLLSQWKSRKTSFNVRNPLNVSGGHLAGDVFRVSNNDLLSSMLINEGESGRLHPYYELVYNNDMLARRGGFFYIENARAE